MLAAAASLRLFIGLKSLKIAFLIPSLDAGGAQRQFVQLATGLSRRGHEITVITFLPGGRYWDELANCQAVRVVALGQRRRQDRLALGPRLLPLIGRLRQVLRQERPDVLYSALHIANLLAWLATFGGRKLPLVWGVRASHQDLPWRRRLPFECCRLLSGSVDLVIANAHSGLSAYSAVGYSGRNSAIIANGIDTDLLYQDRRSGEILRREWKVANHEVLIGVVGRLAPVKDHATFLAAAAQLVCRGASDLRFVCVGGGPDGDRKRLLRLAADLGLEPYTIWAGERRDMPRVYNAIDFLCLPSRSEAFPNVVGEAMACGVPSVVTDVGDAAIIVGEFGVVVPPGDATALAKGLERLLAITDTDRRKLENRCRQRIIRCFGLSHMLSETERVLVELLQQRSDCLSRRRPTSEGHAA